jgi:hypothetical protein
MGKRYVVELELDEEQVESWEQAQRVAAQLRELLLVSAGSLRGYPARRAQIEALHTELAELAPQLGWMMLEGEVSGSQVSAQVRQDAPTRELTPVPRHKAAPTPAPAAPVDLDAERAAFERALAQRGSTKVAPTEDRAVVVGRVEGLQPVPLPPRRAPRVAADPAPVGDHALAELRQKWTAEAEVPVAPIEEPPAPPTPRVDQHRLAEMISSFGNSPQDLAANPGSEIGQILSGLTRVTTKQWKSLMGRSRLALAAYLVARLHAARQLSSRLERGASKHADRVRQAMQLIKRLCGADAKRVPGLLSDATPQGSWGEVASTLRMALEAYAQGGESAPLYEAIGLAVREPAPAPARPAAQAKEPAQLAPPTPSLAPAPAPPAPCADDQLRQIYERLHAGDMTDAQLGVALGSLLSAGVKPTETRLVNLATRLDERHINGKEFKALRTARRKRLKEAEAAEDDAPTFAPPDDWPLWDKVRGKRMVIVGGDRRGERAEAIQQAFALADVEWIECREDSPRPVQALVERMRNQTVDLVVVLQRLVSHSHSDAIFAAERGTCHVILSYSYGLQNVMQGLERFLGGPGFD